MVDYKWRAFYDDGTVLCQFEEGKENLFSDIKLDKLQTFEVYTDEDVPTKSFGLIMENGQFFVNGVILNLAPELNTVPHKLIYFRRRYEHFGQLGPLGGGCFHILGFESNVNNKTQNYMYAINEDGLGIVRLHKK